VLDHEADDEARCVFCDRAPYVRLRAHGSVSTVGRAIIETQVCPGGGRLYETEHIPPRALLVSSYPSVGSVLKRWLVPC
jgi:hypothetical protein